MEILTEISKFLGTSNDTVEIFLYGYLAFILTGVILGFTKKVFIYKDFNDLGISILIFLIPAILLIFLPLMDIKPSNTVLYIFLIFDLVLLIGSLIMSVQANNNIFIGVVTFFVKIPLSLIFSLLVLDLFMPNKRRRRNANKGILFLILAIYTPILIALIKEKNGFFRPNSILSRSRYNY